MAWRVIPFVKAHGLGNDFLMIEAADCAGVTVDDLARRMCDRHTGVGADGIVLLGQLSSADSTFRIFNSDGSEATLSGNALRCAAAVRASRSGGTPGPLVFETRVGRRSLELVSRQGQTWVFRAEMGKPNFGAAEIPFRPAQNCAEPIVGYPMIVAGQTVAVTVLFMGNPQCVLFVNEWQKLDWQAVGRELERHEAFPDRANIGFVRVVSEERIEARFWERGAGHTLASGTGSCACVVASHLNQRTGRRVTVSLERGELEVHWRTDDMVELTGPAAIVAQGGYIYETGEQE
jgi:diaminopimelate epimerase